MSDDEADFTQVFRGYDKDEVAKAIQSLRRELIQANTQNAEAAREVKRLATRIDDLNAEIEEVGNPTFSGLGTKLENTLRVAEEQSTRVIAQADIDAEKLRAATNDDVELLRQNAVEQTERTLSDAAV